MFCKNCANPMHDQAAVCVKCGVPAGKGQNFCQQCGQPINPGQTICTHCGVALNTVPAGAEQKSKLAAGLLAIFLGSFGVHNFYLGYTSKAVTQLVCTLVGIVLSCIGIGALVVLGIEIWAIVEGVQILCGNIKVDGQGIPLKD